MNLLLLFTLETDYFFHLFIQKEKSVKEDESPYHPYHWPNSPAFVVVTVNLILEWSMLTVAITSHFVFNFHFFKLSTENTWSGCLACVK